MNTPVFDLASHLVDVCAPQIALIRTHPWIRAAAKDQLREHQIGSWATQDLLWGSVIGPAYELGFTNPTPGAQLALDFLKGNDAAETAYLESTSKNFQNAPNADIIWPGFLGYGTWGSQVAQTEQPATPSSPHLLALTVVWVAEYAYNQAWHVVLSAQPKQAWAQFGAKNWGGPAFDAMVRNLSDGLNEAAAADSVPTATVEAIAVQGFRWEARAWTDSYECVGWDNPSPSDRN